MGLESRDWRKRGQANSGELRRPALPAVDHGCPVALATAGGETGRSENGGQVSGLRQQGRQDSWQTGEPCRQRRRDPAEFLRELGGCHVVLGSQGCSCCERPVQPELANRDAETTYGPKGKPEGRQGVSLLGDAKCWSEDRALGQRMGNSERGRQCPAPATSESGTRGMS